MRRRKRADRPDGPSFFDAVPVEHTETQAVWAKRMEGKYKGLMEAVLQAVAAARGEGVTGWEALEALGEPERRIVGVRTSLTLLHQDKAIIRTAIERDEQHVYVAPFAWRPPMGLAPSKPHRGRGS